MIGALSSASECECPPQCYSVLSARPMYTTLGRILVTSLEWCSLHLGVGYRLRD